MVAGHGPVSDLCYCLPLKGKVGVMSHPVWVHVIGSDDTVT